MKAKHFLAFGLAAALFASCGNVNTTSSSQEQEPSIDDPVSQDCYTVSFNKQRLTWIKDVPGDMKQGKETFPTIPDEVLAEAGCQDGIPSSMSCFFLEADGEKILFDAGLGREGSLLIPTLKQMGTNPEDLKYVYITHLHGDHIGNLVKDGQKVFPNAKIYINSVEEKAWRAKESGNEAQLNMLEVYKDNLVLFEAGETLPGGVISMDAYGHTAGHTIFQKGVFLIVGDIMHGVGVQINHPEYSPRFDENPEMATESRKRVIEMAKSKKLVMAGMHFPDHGFVSFSPDVDVF